MPNNIVHIPTPRNFKYPEITPTNFRFGTGTQVEATPLRSNGDWRDFLPPEEEQRRHGIESSACFIEAQQHAIATILEEQYGIINSNFSARYNLTFSEATPEGGSPLVGASSIRNDGLIPDELLPFSDEIKSWKEFNSFKGADEITCLKAGQAFLDIWDPKNDIVFTKDKTVEDKYACIKEALRFSPLPVSVTAWFLNKTTGLYVKPQGHDDAHLVLLVYLDENNSAYIFDTYPPFVKKLEPNFNFDFGLRWTVNKRETPRSHQNWVNEIIVNVFEFIKDIILKMYVNK